MILMIKIQFPDLRGFENLGGLLDGNMNATWSYTGLCSCSHAPERGNDKKVAFSDEAAQRQPTFQCFLSLLPEATLMRNMMVVQLFTAILYAGAGMILGFEPV
jgi:hypothetical protein